MHLFPYLPKHYAAIFSEIGKPDADHDPRYADQRAALRNSDSLYRDIRAIAPLRTTAQWLEYCRKTGIPATRVATLQDLVDRLPLATHPAAGRYRLIPQMARFSRTQGPTLRREAPLIGENTGEVLTELREIESARRGQAGRGGRAMTLVPTTLTRDERLLQREVREFLDERLPEGSYEISLGMPGISDPQFSRDLGRRGWLGMAISQKYGGGGRTAVERLIVVEELLARGAPVSYHWVADRQSGPSIERYGSEEQKREYLPRICRGELSFAIGMSEPDAGSDLASLRSRAERAAGGWLINGTKIWTSGAAEATHILGLFRTSEDRHAGLTQFIIACDTPGVRISPIPFIDGSQHFCEVAFEDVRLSDENRLGQVGDGWKQNTSELVLERGGVDRWMSLFPVIEKWAPAADSLGAAAVADLGVLTARFWGLRGLCLSLARLVERGRVTGHRGGHGQGDGHPVRAGLRRDGRPAPGRGPGPDLRESVRVAARPRHPGVPVVVDPRGHQRDPPHGHRERAGPLMESGIRPDPALMLSVGEFFAALTADGPGGGAAADTPGGAQLAGQWAATEALGLPLAGIPEERGGSGGSLQDLLAVLMSTGQHAVPLPLAETSLAAWLLSASGQDVPPGMMTVVTPDPRDTLSLSAGRISGTARQVPWARSASLVVALVPGPASRRHVVAFDPAGSRITAGTDLAGQPRDEVETGQPVTASGQAAAGTDDLFWRGALLRAAQMAGAIAAVDRLTRRYTGERIQFGKPIARFQAVQQHIVTIAQAAEMSAMGVWGAAAHQDSFTACAAKLLANDSARVTIRSAHQAHGAIGMTREYPLHRYTRRLNAWRQDFGTEARLSLALGGAISSAGSFAQAISAQENGISVTCPT